MSSSSAHGAGDGNLLVAIFQEKGIRILGTTEEPKFCASDIAKHIGNVNGDRTFRENTPEGFIQWELVRNARGELRKTRFLTEPGLYRYLLRSGRPRAEEFQAYVYDLLKAERKRLVSRAQIELRIAQTRCEEYKQATKLLQAEVVQVRSGLGHSELDNLELRRELAEVRREAKELRQDRAHLELDNMHYRREIAAHEGRPAT